MHRRQLGLRHLRVGRVVAHLAVAKAGGGSCAQVRSRTARRCVAPGVIGARDLDHLVGLRERRRWRCRCRLVAPKRKGLARLRKLVAVDDVADLVIGLPRVAEELARAVAG